MRMPPTLFSPPTAWYRRGLRVALTVLAAGIVLGGCSPAEPESGAIKIGLATAQTGTLAPFDGPVVQGFKLGIEQLNAAGPLKFELIEKNVRSDAAQTAIAAQELIDARVSVLILPCDADLAIAAASLAVEAGVPAFSTCSSTPTLPTTGQGWLFLNMPGDNAQATASAQWAWEQGYRNAAIVQSPDAQYTTLPLYFADAFKQLGGKLVGDIVYKAGQQNFAAEISRIKALNPAPDVIMTAAYEPDFPAFIRQLRAAGITTQVIGSDGIDTPTTLSLGDAVDGLVYTTAGFPESGGAYETFRHDFAQRYGRPSDTVFDAVGYDLAQVIAAAATAAGPHPAPRAIRDAIDNLSGVAGVTSAISYRGNSGLPQRQIALVRIEHGKASLVARLSPPAELIPPPRF